MKIAVWHNLPSGGGKRALRFHLEGLARRGHTVKIWHPPVPDNQFSALEVAGEDREVPLATLPEVATGPPNLLRYANLTRFDVQAMQTHCKACAEQMQTEKWDLLFTNTCRAFGAPFMGRFTALPKILYLQEPHRPLYEPMPKLPWVALSEDQQRDWTPRGIKTRMRDRVDLASARRMGREELLNAKAHDRILVNSYFSRESVLRAYGLDSRVCYLGVDTELFRDLGLAREPLVVGLGTISPSKNVELAIRAVAAMREPRPTLHWVGNMSDPPYLESMNRLAETLTVVFKTTVMATDEELVDLLNRASAMIYTSRLEPFGLAPLEANACGCPVVAVPEGGIRETIEHGRNGYLVSSDPTALAEALQLLLGDGSLVQNMGRDARELVVSKWSVAASVDRLEAEMKGLLA